MAKKNCKHKRLHLPKLTGSKASKRAYNRAYWRKVASKKRR